MENDTPNESLDALRNVVRFILPVDAKVLIVSEGDREVYELFRGRDQTAWHFPLTQRGIYAGPYPNDGHELISQLEAMRTRGAQFLLFPRRTIWWLDHYGDLRQHLERRYRLVLREPATCVVYALHALPDLAFRTQGAPDDLPLPPPEMLKVTVAHYNSRLFYDSGIAHSTFISDVVAANGRGMDSFDAVLDFGCGCGRVIRHWRTLTQPALFGTDYNPHLVRWCQDSLPFASFQRNELQEPLHYQEAAFDFIYGISIFTHLEESQQSFWLDELKRVLRPGGLLLLTFHGEAMAGGMSSQEMERFRAGELVVRREELSGENACTTFHPEEYVRRTLAHGRSGLEVMDFIPGGSRGDAMKQDAFLFEKRLSKKFGRSRDTSAEA